jgi:hypothetical protein
VSALEPDFLISERPKLRIASRLTGDALYRHIPQRGTWWLKNGDEHRPRLRIPSGLRK